VTRGERRRISRSLSRSQRIVRSLVAVVVEEGDERRLEVIAGEVERGAHCGLESGVAAQRLDEAREALVATTAPVVGLSPIIGGTHVRGMAWALKS